jgi:hypothetical protein
MCHSTQRATVAASLNSHIGTTAYTTEGRPDDIAREAAQHQGMQSCKKASRLTDAEGKICNKRMQLCAEASAVGASVIAVLTAG